MADVAQRLARERWSNWVGNGWIAVWLRWVLRIVAMPVDVDEHRAQARVKRVTEASWCRVGQDHSDRFAGIDAVNPVDSIS